MAKQEKEIYRSELAKRQLAIKEAGLPVIVILEGWGASGKGSAIKSIIKFMDPRFFSVHNMDVMSEEEERKPFLYRHALRMPAAGQFAFFDGSYMDEITKKYLFEKISSKEYKRALQSIIDYERQLVDNGYLLVKFFLDIDKKTQCERLEELLDSKNTKWRVTKEDIWQNENHKDFGKLYHKYIKATDKPYAPWHEIRADDKEEVERFIANTIIGDIDKCLKKKAKGGIKTEKDKDKFEIVKTLPLSKISLKDKVLTAEEYKKKLKSLRKELAYLGNVLYRKKIPVIIAYEGWDAAGKGGNIKRIAAALDPRGYEVFPIASPSSEEKSRHYLWRFWNRLPKTGHIAIFDRTWYGRVMVERLEGFCSKDDWKRAYNEINEFERDLCDWGAIVIKFWVQIDKDTQLERFTLRQDTPEKQWKITEEDWRNREKWDQYEVAIDEMIKKTNTRNAPWYVLESNDKKYARIKALEILIQEIKHKI